MHTFTACKRLRVIEKYVFTVYAGIHERLDIFAVVDQAAYANFIKVRVKVHNCWLHAPLHWLHGCIDLGDFTRSWCGCELMHAASFTLYCIGITCAKRNWCSRIRGVLSYHAARAGGTVGGDRYCC